MATTAEHGARGDSLLGDHRRGSDGADDPCSLDLRAWDASADADPRVVGAWESVLGIAHQGPGPLGLAAGERPIADVEVLAGLVASAEHALARSLHAGAAAGCAPLAGRGALLRARGGSGAWANRVAPAPRQPASGRGRAGPGCSGCDCRPAAYLRGRPPRGCSVGRRPRAARQRRARSGPTARAPGRRGAGSPGRLLTARPSPSPACPARGGDGCAPLASGMGPGRGPPSITRRRRRVGTPA